jgi:hypothetical protein
VVAHTGATDGPGRVRSLNRPRPLRVEAGEDGRPVAVYLSGRRCAVEAVQETWRIDDEWWRGRPVSRVYYQLGLMDGRTVVVYEDVTQGRWYVQRYA